jgi:ribokinase
LSAGPTPSSVQVLGSINLDTVYRMRRLPRAGETVLADGLEHYPGGKGANQAMAAARWGAPTSLIGAVGRDEPGERLLAHLKAAGVDVTNVARLAETPTGIAQICVSDEGENMIVVVSGANRAVTPEWVAQIDPGGAAVFLAQLETPLDAVEAFLRRGRGAGGVTILNAAPALEVARPLFDLADIVVCNQGELALYAEATEPGTPEAARELAAELLGRTDQTLVITLGASGALAVTAGGIIAVPGHPARVVDTTGAGDCFCGVLAAALAEGELLEPAMRLANRAAALSTQQSGAAVPPDLRARVKALA